MSLFRSFFKKKEQRPIPAIPSWDEIVEHMQGKELSGFADTVVKVLVSCDRAKRILILKSEAGFYKVLYEAISVYEEEEWRYVCWEPDRYPAFWEAAESSINTISVYPSEEDALKEVKISPEYKAYFV